MQITAAGLQNVGDLIYFVFNMDVMYANGIILNSFINYINKW